MRRKPAILSKVIPSLLSVLFLSVTASLLAQTDSAHVSQSYLVESSEVVTIIPETTVILDDSTGEQIYPLSPERQQLLIEYSDLRNKWRFVDFFGTIALLAILLFTKLSARMRDWAAIGRNGFLALWIYWGLFVLASYLLSFPLHYYRDFVVEKEFGFLNLTFGGWLSEDLLMQLLTFAIGIIPLWIFYTMVKRFANWWLWFSLAVIPLIVISVVLVPVFISPLFNDFKPLSDKQLEAQILSLAESVGIEGSDVFEVNASKQSSKINAYVTGLFNTKRIVLYDTLLKNFTRDEILFVMGHEMGHYVLHHVWQGLALGILIIVASLWLISRLIHGEIRRNAHRFGFDHLSDFASLPLVLLFITVISFFSEPISNSFSRSIEHRADVYGMDVTPISGESAATAFDKLAVFNLADPDPHPLIEFWFYSHPALKKRMEFVRSVRE